jgi:hypothetical protein
MSPTINEYLFVYSEKDGTFPVRLRVVKEQEDTDIPDADKLTGMVDKADVVARRAELEHQYPAPEFRVATSWANRWVAVQNNYAGLDYEYDSPDGGGSGPPHMGSQPLGQVLLETSDDWTPKPSRAPSGPREQEAAQASQQPPETKIPKDAEYYSTFLCPGCSEKTVRIETSIELGSDSRSDECSLQAVRCERCNLVGAAIYEESRRGAGESTNHFGYKMDSADYEAFLQQLLECRNRGKAKCSCKAHEKFGLKDEHGTLRPLDLVQHDKAVFPMRYQ